MGGTHNEFRDDTRLRKFAQGHVSEMTKNQQQDEAKHVGGNGCYVESHN